MIRILASFGLIFALANSVASAQSGQPVPSQDSVFIEGAVQKPGVYPLAAKMTPMDLVDLAGGFQSSADRIMIISATVRDSSGKPIVETITVQKLKTATKDKPLPELKAGDRVLVRSR